jgi:hypothetical protein
MENQDQVIDVETVQEQIEEQQQENQKPHVNVVIATPGRTLTAEYVKSLMATIQVLNANGITWHYQNEYASLVTNAREATITGSRNLEIFNSSPGKGYYTYDKIFCIDSDIVWNPEHFIKLFTSGYDVISGVYFESEGRDAVVHQTKDSFRFMSRAELELYQKAGDPIPVYGVGLGFICIRQGVFEKIKRPWYGLGKVKQEVDGVEYEIPLGEDLYWCERVAENGDIVHLDPTVVVGHVKSNIVV